MILLVGVSQSATEIRQARGRSDRSTLASYAATHVAGRRTQK